MTGWNWIKDGDGVTRCYYLNPNADGTRGKMAVNTTVENIRWTRRATGLSMESSRRDKAESGQNIKTARIWGIPDPGRIFNLRIYWKTA